MQHDIRLKIDHNKLIQTVVDNDGILVGGYVREWVRFGEPQNFGWNDIDVFCKNPNSLKIIRKEIYRLGVNCDFRAIPPFNDFFCNCWMFDGEIKPVEPVDKTFSTEEIMNQTKTSQAFMMNCCTPRKDKVKNFMKNGWNVIFPNGYIPSEEFLKFFFNAPPNFSFAMKEIFGLKPSA